jgi:DNA-binding NarL/FixJ family response regulator
MMVKVVSEGRISVLYSEYGALEVGLVRILVVDDFEPFRTLVSSIMKDQPAYQIVGEAADGLRAVERAKELKPDLVVLDMGLPELNGVEVARQIRRCSPGSAILFLTGNNDPELAREALYAGARGYVLKVDIVSELVMAVRAVLSGRLFISRRLRESSANANR